MPISVQRQSPSQAPKPESSRPGMRPKAPRQVARACESLGAWKADGSSKLPRASRGCRMRSTMRP
eukprot:308052-Heterocapsa_arctica.AAC.1